jgi:dipeptidyl-peptidase-4
MSLFFRARSVVSRFVHPVQPELRSAFRLCYRVSGSLACVALALLPGIRPLNAQTQPGGDAAQPGRVYTDADYARAEKFMPYNVNRLVLHTVQNSNWMPDDRLWYLDRGSRGSTFFVVDPAQGTKHAAFDQAKMAVALQPFSHGGTMVSADRLPVSDFLLAPGNDSLVLVEALGQRLRCDLSGAGVCTAIDKPSPAQTGAAPRGRRAAGGEVFSPDGSKAAFIRDWNLWMRDTASNKEVQLTFDGVLNYGYATDNAGWTHSDNAILVWSPDSKRIATFQQDQRKTGEMYTVSTRIGHPHLETWKYPFVGDKDVTMIERVVINLGGKDDDKPKLVRLKMPPDQHRSTLCDDISCRGGDGWDDVEWAADSKSLAFVSTARDHEKETVRIANPNNGDVRDIFSETSKTFLESGIDKVNWHYLSASNQILWYSSADNWGHLYLYDIATGKQTSQITKGDWDVGQVLYVDQKAKTIFFTGYGREKGVDPYFGLYYRVNFDGSDLNLLTPEKANHTITPSPDNKYFLDVFSTPTDPPIAVMRDNEGKVVVDVARADITRLKAAGWIAPVPIMVKARDGVTDLYGLLFRPTNFSTDGHYPIVNHVYPGPQVGSCGPRNFLAAHGDLQSLAELGFIVVCIDGEGTPFRSQAFHAAYFGNLGDDTIPDQVTGMQQLAERYPWIDLSRAGMYGHSGGGNATASAMFHFPDFFKVGIAESGNHDNRDYEDDWAEKWAGLEIVKPDGTSNYDAQANGLYAKNLKGHLLLAHGTMDDNVPLNNTLLVVDALIKANKDFDLILFPNAAHGYGAGAQYMTRRRWDYFVRYLAGATPPLEYKMTDYNETQRLLHGGGPMDADWSEINNPSEP